MISNKNYIKDNNKPFLEQIVLTCDIKMADFTFEGEIEILSVKQQEFLCETLEKMGYKGNRVHIQSVGKAGDNYAAVVKRITIYGNDGDILKMIAKVAPTHEVIRVNSSSDLLFTTEIIMYSDVLPQFTKLQISADIPKEHQLRHAKFYGALKEAPYEFILLEDLQTSGFKMLDRFQPLTNESVKLILQNFAILHSMSFVLKNEAPETFKTFQTTLVDFFATMSTTPEFQAYLPSLENDCLKLLDTEHYKKVIRNTVSQMGEEASRLSKIETDSKYLVVAQGDAWTNNIMFRLQEEKPVEAIMIDYQLSKVSSPAADLLYMIFNCTDHSTRLNHYHEWIDFYYSELEKSLSRYGISFEAYPRDQLNTDLKNYSKMYLIMVTIVSSMLIRTSEEASKIMESMELELNENNMDGMLVSKLDQESVSLFKRRIEGVIDSYYEFGYIN